MEVCKNCKWYNKEFDDGQATMNDTDFTEHHYCPMFMYPEHIKPKVYEGEQNCNLFMAK